MGTRDREGRPPNLRAFPPYLSLPSPLRMTRWLSELQAERRWQPEKGLRGPVPGSSKRPDRPGPARPGCWPVFSANRTINIHTKHTTDMVSFDSHNKIVR